MNEEDLSSKFNTAHEIINYYKEHCKKHDVKSINEAEKIFSQFLNIITKIYKIDEPREKVNYISNISLVLHFLFPDYFFPFFFDSHFFRLEEILVEFDIMIPPKPSKNNYDRMAYYYYELCKSLYDFRCRHELSSLELNIFLYGLSLNLIPKLIMDDLPSPTKVFISGATEDDVEQILSVKGEDICHWQGNENSNPGDIFIVYGLKPHSKIVAIFRCLSKGEFEPFDYWSNRVWIGKKIKVPMITFAELQNDSVWKEKPLVKAHMQGISGTPCTKAEYDSLLKIFKKKKYDINKLPKLPEIGLSIKESINTERDVEKYLLEPLLVKLGYTEKDWKRQLPIRMGRGERFYPDYAILPRIKKGEESCEFVVEAKFRITNQKQLQDAFYQAKSYALRLGCFGLILVAQEGIWFSLKENEFDFKKIEDMDWERINHFDGFSKLKSKFEKARTSHNKG